MLLKGKYYSRTPMRQAVNTNAFSPYPECLALQINSFVKLLSCQVVSDSATPGTAAHQASLPSTILLMTKVLTFFSILAILFINR